MLNRVRRVSPLAWMVALLLIAAILRLAAWQSAPPGLRFDEMLVSYHADLIRAGARPIYIDDLAEEPLYHYLFAAAQDLIAPHLFTLRWLSAACGLIGVAALYTLGRLMFNQRVGLLAAAIASVAFWSLMYSNLGLRLIALTPFVLMALIFLWRGFTRARRREFIISGALLGLSAYTYSATRMLPVAFVGFAIILVIFNRPFLRKHGRNLALMLLTAALIVLPLAYHIATVPAAERRLGEVEGPLDALAKGEVQPLINSTLVTAGMFIATGDSEWLYNIPNRPVFDALTGAIFFGAVILSLRRLRQPAYAFVLSWLLAGLLPAVLTWPAASNSHSFLAQTPAFLLAAIGLDALATRWPKYGGLAVLVSLLVFSTVSLHDYFNRWAADATVRREHQADIVQIARQVDQLPAEHRPIVFSSGAVMHWNPWSLTAFRLTAPIGFTATRWFDARSSFIFPHGQTDLTLINAALDDQPAPLDSRLIEDLFPVVEPIVTSSAAYSATHLVSSLSTRLGTLARAEVTALAGPAETPISPSLTLPLDFGNRLELIGYEVRRPIVQPGKNIRLTTYWRAKDRGVEPLSFFVHVLDAQGNIAAQWDGYSYSPYYVQPGDIIAQVHFIPLPPDFAEGTYRLQLGLYHSMTGERIPLTVAGRAIADRVLLQTVDVQRQ